MKKPFIDRLFWVLNIIVLVALILSYLAAYISPAQLWWLALFGLAYGTLLVINLCFVIFWILRKNKKYRYSLFISILGIGKIFGMYQPSFKKPLLIYYLNIYFGDFV